ncbi:MAG: hypothetical protein LBO05_04100 [Deltaproteobacteria bacterium]|jgi:hypothetical protein|nr:hypothetical protein [Deltaproteobacteria bacterium]
MNDIKKTLDDRGKGEEGASDRQIEYLRQLGVEDEDLLTNLGRQQATGLITALTRETKITKRLTLEERIRRIFDRESAEWLVLNLPARAFRGQRCRFEQRYTLWRYGLSDADAFLVSLSGEQAEFLITSFKDGKIQPVKGTAPRADGYLGNAINSHIKEIFGNTHPEWMKDFPSRTLSGRSQQGSRDCTKEQRKQLQNLGVRNQALFEMINQGQAEFLIRSFARGGA